MAEATNPVWRQALQDREHDLYRAAWTIFMQGMSIEVASARLEAQKDAVTELLIEIIQDDDLYERNKPGAGTAPVNAVRLLGEWKVTEQFQMLLETLEATNSYQQIYNVLLNSIAAFGTSIVDDLLKWAEENEDMHGEAAQILERIGNTPDGRPYDAILSWMEPDEFDVKALAETLIELDAERAVKDLRALSNNREFDKEERDEFRELSKEARKVSRTQKKAAKSAAQSVPATSTSDAKPAEPVADAEAEPAAPEAATIAEPVAEAEVTAKETPAESADNAETTVAETVSEAEAADDSAETSDD